MTTASDNQTWPKLRNCCDKLCFSVVSNSLRFRDGKLTLLKSSMTDALSLYTGLCRRAGSLHADVADYHSMLNTSY